MVGIHRKAPFNVLCAKWRPKRATSLIIRCRRAIAQRWNYVISLDLPAIQLHSAPRQGRGRPVDRFIGWTAARPRTTYVPRLLIRSDDVDLPL